MPASFTAEAWARLAEQRRLRERLDRGEVVLLSADDIRAVGREPRLMTKFDTRESRPEALSDATILPVANGQYVVLPGDGYADLDARGEARVFPMREALASLRTLPWASGPASEAQALDMALASGILGDFLGDPAARLTVRGRHRSPRFQFRFRCRDNVVPLTVEGVQIEVDSGLEGDGIHLVEAKLGTRTNFHVRQLYYPLRSWLTEVPDKSVTTSFLTWSNRVFSLRRYEFDPLDDYQAMRLASAIDYTLDADEGISLADVLASTTEEALPTATPFPQANDLRRVVDVVDAVGAGAGDQAGIAARYDFDERQADYYGNAAAFLGLLARTSRGFQMAPQGARMVQSERGKRNKIVVRRMASLPVFRDALTYLASQGKPPPIDDAASWIARKTALTGTTPRRRAQTVVAWTRWAQTALSGKLSGGGDR